MEANNHSIFEEKTGYPLYTNNQLVVCHICDKVYSPVRALLIPTDLCVYYANTYKRMCAIYYLDDTVCSHVTLTNSKWGAIFLGDTECLPATILAKFSDIQNQQPDQELCKKAFNYAMTIYSEFCKSKD